MNKRDPIIPLPPPIKMHLFAANVFILGWLKITNKESFVYGTMIVEPRT